MLRKGLKKHLKPSDEFKLRGLDNTRIEALSDGVFALAIALLLISSEVPETYSELKDFLKNFFPFAATISILTLVWYQHYVFFIRYGLKNSGIVALNTLLLFLILFFVYPLKFLFEVLFKLFSALWSNNQEDLEFLFQNIISQQDAPELMIFYGFGGTLVFTTMASMYMMAYKKRKTLQLTAIELFDTKSNIYTNLLMASIPFVSALLSFFEIGGGGTGSFSLSGMTYYLYPLVMPLYGFLREKARRRFVFNQNQSNE